ncbi:MAG TPA: hypothetical protein VNO43_11530 [Candidatus Eisenbacteria bacterium]|nr:hypothetical protein [Candidatus Eisenbacteria bacterium]
MPQLERQKRKRAGGTNEAAVGTQSRQSPSSQAADGIPTLEWVIGAVGFLLVASVIGFLVYQALTGDRQPPDVQLNIESIVQTTNGYMVHVKAVNHGGSTAEGVVVAGRLLEGAVPLERSETTVDYLPPRSEKKIGLFFTRDPRNLRLELRALGYEAP